MAAPRSPTPTSAPRPRRALGRFAAILAAWTAAGLLIATQAALQLRLRGESRALLSVFGPSLAGAWMWALYTPGVMALTRRLRRLRERPGPAWPRWTAWLAAHAAVVAVGAVADSAAWARVRPLIDGTVVSWQRVFALTLLTNVASYVAVATLTEAIDFAARWRERERAAEALARTAEELRGRLEEARLHALEAQLRPHFLYNTLNLVAELVHDEPEAADEMLTRLGALLRRAYQEGPHLVPLREELAFATAYADILTRRYRDRVMLTVDVPDALGAHPVPAYALQPLVENAFRHGVERRERPTAVEIAAESRDGAGRAALVVRVRDRGLGGGTRARAASSVAGDGVGMRNTRERLAALYGPPPAAGLTLTRRGDETTAELWLPLDARAVEGPGDGEAAPRAARATATGRGA